MFEGEPGLCTQALRLISACCIGQLQCILAQTAVQDVQFRMCSCHVWRQMQALRSAPLASKTLRYYILQGSTL